MGLLEKIDDKNFVIKIKTAEITSSRPFVQFSHFDCFWRLSYHQYRDIKRVYKLSCTGSDSDLWNLDASVTFEFFKQDGTKGITRSVNYLFNVFTRHKECTVKVTTGLPIADFNAVYPDAEVHVKIYSLTGFQRVLHCLNFKKNKQLVDVALIVEGKKLHANKAVLATFSPVFRAMFFSSFKESTDEEVVIKDAEYDDFLEFLEVMHNAYSKIYDPLVVESVLVLADRYDVGVVMEKCEQYLLSTDDDDDFTDPKYVELAETYNLPKLLKKCMDSIDKKNKSQKPLNAQIRSMKKRKLDDPTSSKMNENIKPITKNQRKTVMEFDKEDGQLSDFAFVFEGKKLFVNKAVLATFSPVFRAMFFPESKQSIDQEMIINDANYDDFEQFLQVFHTAYPLINNLNIETILILADRYKVEIVMEKCESYLLFTDKIDNADKLRLAETYSLLNLHDKIMYSYDTMKKLISLSCEKGRFGPMTLRVIMEKMVDIEKERVDRGLIISYGSDNDDDDWEEDSDED